MRCLTQFAEGLMDYERSKLAEALEEVRLIVSA